MSLWNLFGFGRKSRPVLDQQFLNRQRGSLPLPRTASATETVESLKDEEIERPQVDIRGVVTAVASMDMDAYLSSYGIDAEGLIYGPGLPTESPYPKTKVGPLDV